MFRDKLTSLTDKAEQVYSRTKSSISDTFQRKPGQMEPASRWSTQSLDKSLAQAREVQCWAQYKAKYRARYST